VTQADDTNLWYYGAGTEQKGPFTLEQMAALIQAGVIGAATLVWSPGMATWAPFSDSPLAQEMPLPPRTAFGPRPASSSLGGAPAAVSGIGDAVRTCFRQYVTFSGRAGRPEFWYFMLFVVLGGILTVVLDFGLLGADGDLSPLNTVFSLATMLPQLAVGVRRLHDTDRSGWWILIGFIPLVGIITLIVFWCQAGTQGRNRFG